MGVTDLANKALAFADKALGMAIEFLKKLTAYTLTSVGFKMSNSVGPSVELNAAILNRDTRCQRIWHQTLAERDKFQENCRSGIQSNLFANQEKSPAGHQGSHQKGKAPCIRTHPIR